MARGRKDEPAPRDIGAKLAPEHPFHDLIAEAYRLFPARKPPALGVCRQCCMDPGIEADFLEPDRAHLPLAYVQDWFFAAAEIPMPKAPWAYLLPRVLEVLAAGEEPSTVGLEVSLSRFPTGDPGQWTDAQHALLTTFAARFIDHQRDNRDAYLDDVLCMFGTAGFALPPLLAVVEAWPDAALADKLAHDWATVHGAGSIWITAFWEAPLNSEVFAWYTSRALYDRMVAFGMDPDSPRDAARRALDVADVIEVNADWWDQA